MRQAILRFSAWLYVLCVSFPTLAQEGLGPLQIERKFDEFTAFIATQRFESEARRSPLISNKYQELFSDQLAVSVPDLDKQFRAADLVSFFTLDARFVERMDVILARLEQLNGAEARHYEALHEAWVSTRHFHRANALARSKPSDRYEPLPFFSYNSISSSERGVWTVDPTIKVLRLQGLELQKGVRVVVISHPLCKFSRSAAKAISAHPEFRGVMDKHGVWLAPQDRLIHFDTLQRWNRENPESAIDIVDKRTDWPMMGLWSTPTFYFLVDGRVVDEFTGWPEVGNIEKFKAAVEKLNLSVR